LSERIAQLLPPEASVLDVGCGDGYLASLIEERLPGVRIEGVDVLVRDESFIPVKRFDGRRLPYEQDSFDVVTFNDVLHHTADPRILLREAVRVARHAIVIKDHVLEGILAGWTLRGMDRVGNRRFGVRLPNNYWRRSQWLEAFDDLGTNLDVWDNRVNLYCWPFSILFDRHLHFTARLAVNHGAAVTS
jgi:SAM-dependent methyltransferase